MKLSDEEIERVLGTVKPYIGEKWIFVDTNHAQNDSDKYNPHKEKHCYVAKQYWGAICWPPTSDSPQYSRHRWLMKAISKLPVLAQAIRQLMEERDRCREALVAIKGEHEVHAPAKGDGWLDIGALKPNTRAILTFNFTDVYTGQLENDGMFYDGSYGIPTPTHYMPLPQPPKSEV